MADRILFLGTGGGREATGKQTRATGGIVIEAGINQFMIDAGPGALAKAKEYGVNPRANTAIIVTHTHLSHANDINAIIDATTLGGQDRNAVILCSKSTIEGTEKLKPLLVEDYKNQLEKVIVLEPGKRIAINAVELHSTKTKHSDETCVGLKIYAQNYTIGYTSDTEYSQEIAEQYKDADILIINMKEPLGEKKENNMNGDDAIAMINLINPKLTILTHFGKNVPDPVIEAREIQRRVKYQVIAAKDGVAVNPLGFTKTTKQTRWHQFSEKQAN